MERGADPDFNPSEKTYLSKDLGKLRSDWCGGRLEQVQRPWGGVPGGPDASARPQGESRREMSAGGGCGCRVD